MTQLLPSRYHPSRSCPPSPMELSTIVSSRLINSCRKRRGRRGATELSFKKVNMGQSSDARQLRLRGITSNKHLRADMLGGGNMDKVPSAGMRV